MSIHSLSAHITPYKFSNIPPRHVSIPPSERFKIPRNHDDSDIIYYFSKPLQEGFPITLVLQGSHQANSVYSCIHVHRYFLEELLRIGSAVISVENQGVDGERIDLQNFLEHYTRSQRLSDYQTVIEYLQEHPPIGWDGRIIVMGFSEGGLIATTLAERYSLTAVINCSGAGDFSWEEELWAFITDNPLIRFLSGFFFQRQLHESLIKCQENPSADRELLGMTYRYHADAMTYPLPDYHRIKSPFLTVTGCKDSTLLSSDAFVKKALEAQVPITYFRVEDMDHYVRKRADVMDQIFDWLSTRIRNISSMKVL